MNCIRAYLCLFGLSVSLWYCCLRWFVAVYSKQVGSLTLLLCVYFWLAARCLVVACLVFFIVCSLLSSVYVFKRQTRGWWQVLVKSMRTYWRRRECRGVCLRGSTRRQVREVFHTTRLVAVASTRHFQCQAESHINPIIVHA